MIGHSFSRRGLLRGTASFAALATAGPSVAAPAQRLPARGNFVIRNAHVMTMERDTGDIAGGDVHVRGGAIAAVGRGLTAPGAQVVDGTGMLVLPGFVETHWHIWTALLRSLAGLWPYVNGSIERPLDGQAMFCGQQPYLPLGTLRTALAYPAPAEDVSDDDARDILRAVQLGHLAERLDVESDWSKTLSPGEQQRLAFGRILLSRPSLVFLDETTSALDEGMEHAIYGLVRERLPECTIVSVGHRSTLENLHSNELTLLGDGTWETRTLVA